MDYKELLEKIQTDTRYYIENFLKVRTKEQSIVPFKLRPAQALILDKLEELKKSNKFLRLIVLKCRQAGVSSVAEGIIFHSVATKPNTQGMVIAHDFKSTAHLLEMSNIFYDNLPDFLRPMKRIGNKKEIWLENPNDRERIKKPGLRSKLIVETASNIKTAGHAFTLHCLHISEIARWTNPEETMIGLMQAVPDTPSSIVIIESTAFGASGYFFEMWNSAVKGENEFTPIFIPWFFVPEYIFKCPPNFILNDEEEELKERFNLDDEQLNWRRWCIENKCKGNIDKFKEQYPATAEEAFIFSGANVFNLERIAEMMNYTVQPIRGRLYWKEEK